MNINEYESLQRLEYQINISSMCWMLQDSMVKYYK